MFRLSVSRLLLVVITALTAILAAPALTAVAAPQTPHVMPADTFINYALRDGCGGANGTIHFSGNNSVDTYGVLWENSTGCAGKTQQLWFSRTFTPGTNAINSPIMPTVGPGQSKGFHSITTIPGVTSGQVTLCSNGPAGFNCWDHKSF